MTYNIDWKPLLKYSPCTCVCHCGTEFRSHAKGVKTPNGFIMVSRIPCPGCFRHDNLRRVTADPEKWEL